MLMCDSRYASSSRIHPASLVDPATHPQSVLRIIDADVSQYLIDYTVDCVTEAAHLALEEGEAPPVPQSASLSHSHRGRTPRRRRRSSCEADDRRRLTDFVSTLVARAQITTPTLLVALIYLSRARGTMAVRSLAGLLTQRLVLGALVLASKYTQDGAMLNGHWAVCTAGLFTTREVGRIERDLLSVLRWELGVREAEVEVQCAGVQKQKWADAAGEGGVADANHFSRRTRSTGDRHRRRMPTMCAVPELDSSPASSCSSLSPRTPEDLLRPSYRPGKMSQLTMSMMYAVEEGVPGILVSG